MNSDPIEITPDMTEEELRVLFNLEGYVAPFCITNQRTMEEFRYDSFDDMAADLRAKRWWHHEH